MHCVRCQSPVRAGTRYCEYCGAPVKPGPWRPAFRLLVVVGLAGVLVLAASQVYNGLKREHLDSVKAASRTTGPTTTIPFEVSTSAEPTVAPATVVPPTVGTTSPPATTVVVKTAVNAASISASAPTAPAPDACGKVNSFAATNLQDGDLSTAYRVKGTGVGRQIRFRLSGATHLKEVGLVPGWAKVDCDGSDLFRQHRTIARVRWTFDGGRSVEQAFTVTPGLQVLPVDVVTKNVTLRILVTNPPVGINMTAISEVRLTAVAPG